MDYNWSGLVFNSVNNALTLAYIRRSIDGKRERLITAIDQDGRIQQLTKITLKVLNRQEATLSSITRSERPLEKSMDLNWQITHVLLWLNLLDQ